MRSTLRVRSTPPVPTSLLRDLTLHLMRKHNPALAKAHVHSTVRYLPRKKLVRATFDFDPNVYLEAVKK